MKNLYYILLIIIIFSCKNNKTKVADSKEIFKQDSLKILSLFKKNKIYPPTKTFSHNNILSYGNIFKNNHNYLIINNDDYKEKTYYLYKNDSLNKILSYSVGGSFLSDTIYDINKDSYLDILVNSSFRSNIINDFYIQSKDVKFNIPLKTYNTTLKGNELLGHVNFNSPIRNFYKFKWNGTSLDTIKWVAYDSSKEDYDYIESQKKEIFKVRDNAEYYIGLNKDEYKRLDELPKEFKELDSLYYK